MSKPSARYSNPTQPATRGKIFARRKTIGTTPVSLPIPSGAKFMVIQNIGSNSVLMNFDDDTASQYWTLGIKAPFNTTPTLPVLDTTTINLKAVGANTILEALFWG